MAEIIVKFEDKIIERIVTEKKRLTIGRTQENDIVLENRGVSRRHAMIEFNEQAAVVVDNESLNGTFVNNRKITEEVLRDDDVITIGKYALIYKANAGGASEKIDLEGTMLLNTKRQKALLENDKLERQIVAKFGGSVLVGEENADFTEFKLEQDVTTIGKAKFTHIRVKGFFLPAIQAKIVREANNFVLISIGSEKKTLVNGGPTTRQVLKNGDIVTVGKTTFRFVDGPTK